MKNYKAFNHLKESLFISNLVYDCNHNFELFTNLNELLNLSNKLRTTSNDIILSNIKRLIKYTK